ncbi:MAG: hypothetical protein AB7L13_23270 [Acidimicrobiia bacterium]
MGTPLNIFFDIDYTLQGMDGSLRPGTWDTFTRLKEDGHTLYIWSGEGVRWREVRIHGLDVFVDDVFGKPLSDHHAKLESLKVPVVPDFVIDDHPGPVVAFGGVCVTAYFGKWQHDDTEMERVYKAVQARVDKAT